jgi:hypothetical protein
MYKDGNASASEAEGEEEADTAAADDDDWEVRGAGHCFRLCFC